MLEQEIIGLIQQRDEKGAEALLKHYGPLMRYIIAPILPDPQDQAECLSEVAMRVWDRIDLFDRERGNWRAWLTAITRNTALNMARKSKSIDMAGDIPPQLPSSEPTPEEAVLEMERREAVKGALEQLSPKDLVLFYRKYYYLQSTAQIASEFSMTERAVEGKLYRLKKQLRNILGGEGHA